MAQASEDGVAETRRDYAEHLTIPTRWDDNDVYGHVNNVQYYAFFDTVINRWLIAEGGLEIETGPVIGLCAESHCRFHAAVAFPDAVEAGLRVGKLGNSSVRYEIGLFREGDEELQKLAQQAKEVCPLSKALASVPEINLEARLAS